MGEDTYARVKALRTELLRTGDPVRQRELLGELLDAHVDDPQGIGVLVLDGQPVYENGGLMSVASLFGEDEDGELSALLARWLDAEPSLPRLYVAGALLPALWRSRRPALGDVYSLLDAYSVVAPSDEGVRGPVLDALEHVLEHGVDPSTATQIVQALRPRHSSYKRPRALTLVPLEPEGPELLLRPEDAALGRSRVLCGLEALALHDAATPDLADRHCVFLLNRGAWNVVSSTGKLNGEALSGRGPTTFGPGDELAFGLIEVRAR